MTILSLDGILSSLTPALAPSSPLSRTLLIAQTAQMKQSLKSKEKTELSSTATDGATTLPRGVSTDIAMAASQNG